MNEKTIRCLAVSRFVFFLRSYYLDALLQIIGGGKDRKQIVIDLSLDLVLKNKWKESESFQVGCYAYCAHLRPPLKCYRL